MADASPRSLQVHRAHRTRRPRPTRALRSRGRPSRTGKSARGSGLRRRRRSAHGNPARRAAATRPRNRSLRCAPIPGSTISASKSRDPGTDLDGIYRGTVTIPRYSEPGTWHLLELNTYDQASNRTEEYGFFIADEGWPAAFTNTSPQ